MPTVKRNRKKRPMAVTLIAWVIFILFLARLVQAFEPLLHFGIFKTGLNGPLFDGLRLTLLGSALLTSTVYSLLSFLFVVIESILRGAFVETVAAITTLLAITSTAILLFHFWYWILIALLLATAVFLMAQRLRELE